MQLRTAFLVLFALLLTVSLTAQAQGSVALVIDAVGDLGFGDMATMAGDRVANDFGARATSVVVDSPSYYLPSLRQLAASEAHDVIIAAGYQFAEAVELVAKEFPGQNFALIDAEIHAPNVLSIVFAEHEGSALAGALAALIALENGGDAIGIVLGAESPPILRFEMGYRWGADWAVSEYNNRFGTNKSVQVLAEYTDTFSDPAVGKSAAMAQLEQGAVVVFAAAGATGLGIFEAIEEAAVAAGKRVGPPFAIGVDSVQDHLSPGFVPTSMVKRVDIGVYTAAQRALTGDFEGGTLLLDLKSNGVGLSTDKLFDLELTSAIESRALDHDDRARIIAQIEAARAAIPAYAWEIVADLNRRITEGEISVRNP